MFSGNEAIVVLIIAVLLFGGSQIPKLARSIGQAQKEFKTGLAEGAADDDPTGTDEATSVDAEK